MIPTCVVCLGCISTLDMHVCEVMPSKYTWTAILLSVYGGEAMGKLLPYIAGLALLSSTSSHSWPYFVMALSIPSLLFIGLALIFIHDSPIYLLSVNKTDEARKSLEKIISRGSHSKLEGGNCTQVGVMDSEIEPMESFECFKYIFKDSYVLRSLICATVTGFSVKYTTYQLSYIVTELVFLSGQTDSDYCSGSERNSYLLKQHDYLMLSGYMVLAFVLKIIAMTISQRMNLSLKLAGVFCLGASICLAACLYLCPKYWIALIIYALIDASSAVVELYLIIFIAHLVPINIRSTVYGFMIFVMYDPLSSTPYLVQVLTKRSQHYLTTTTITFITLSFISVLSLPKAEKSNG